MWKTVWGMKNGIRYDKGPEDVKRLSEEERKELAAEIREFLTRRQAGQAVIWRPI